MNMLSLRNSNSKHCPKFILRCLFMNKDLNMNFHFSNVWNKI